MILMIDNYDSFTYNLVDYLEQLGEEVMVKRNDQLAISDIKDLAPEMIIISPGPGVPKEAGVSMEVINNFKGEIPILGICLGHQAIAEVFNAEIVKALEPKHGTVEAINHYNQGVFNKLANPLRITRYHSLVVAKKNLPFDLEITAVSEEGEVMGLKHKKYLIEGVQFHPEALLTEQGRELLANFIAEARGEKGDRKNSN
ncbi:anthranilate synthase component II [Halanaerobacter jeridensis]|uniref:Para-aminobenzoate synthetase component 2 n=1 Tax=Halanaerobacter jeridensis TaxID=706427 RepID=A0A938XQ34_9FIRM|nr:aminodeoxychorismate/anthranilate synthase component II [Halanaerobacter jeridensis]MBM7555183.1 para-aminobenzoate synthetase component 2 [Halanaerobacter jeridensis]